MSWLGLIKEYSNFLPIKSEKFIVSLKEGNTPLLLVPRLAKKISYPGKLYVKFEGQNPTASFKDRGMTYAVSKAKAMESQVIICASTGNTAASAAAYAARAGMKCLVFMPEGNVALGKISQASAHGAIIVKVKGNFDESLKLVLDISKKKNITLVNSLNPFRIEGQKTIAFEICDVLNQAPDFHALPVGNAGNITATWKGYREYKDQHRIKHLPRMLGFQAKGAAPIVHGKVIQSPETIATAIRIGNPASWKSAELARDESGGVIEMVSDEEILNAYDLIAREEGIFCEPASAAGVAGVKRMAEEGIFTKNSVTVCTLTGHGLKDPETALSRPVKEITIEPKLENALEALKLNH